jgi:hypothetical protein
MKVWKTIIILYLLFRRGGFKIQRQTESVLNKKAISDNIRRGDKLEWIKFSYKKYYR